MDDNNFESNNNNNSNNNKQGKETQKNSFLGDLYDDFFYLISSNPEIFEKKYEEEMVEDTKKDDSEIPKIEIPKTALKSNESVENAGPNVQEKVEAKPKEEKVEVKEISEEEKEAKINDFYERIDNTHLTDESKIVLKKMIDYARKFNSGIAKDYIPFNMRIYTDNDEFLNEIVDIIVDSFYFFGYMKNQDMAKKSFFIIEDQGQITELYNVKNSLVVLKDVDGLQNQEKVIRDRLLNVLETAILDHSNLKGITTIISDSSKEKIDNLFMSNTTLKDKIFDYELFTTPADSQEIYQSILSKLQKDYILTGDFEIKLLDYINGTYKKTTLSSPEYINSTIERILFNRKKDVIDAETIPEFEKNKSIDEIFEELNELVGLDNVKQMLKDLVDLIEFKKKSGSYLKLKDTNLHMVFLGNPGTGKTTVARMIAGILYNLDYIEQNKLIEVSAKDLIGQYVGQTAPKTMEVIQKALGGVLFIDEAYSLASKPGTATTFNEECIATLIQAMENYRDNLVVIFAGYTKEMDAFLKSNSGIISRIGYTMEFKDYTTDELIEIFKSMFKKAGFVVDNKAIEKTKSIIEEFKHTEGFGNARFIRNLYEKTVIKHASNTKNTTSKKSLKTITADDVTAENISKLG